VTLACGHAELVQRATGQPRVLADYGESPHYPRQAAGFTRQQTVAYTPGVSNTSTSYEIETPALRVLATIYEYPNPGGQPIDRFASELAALERSHPGAERLFTREATLNKAGRQHAALYAGYAYDASVLGARQRVYSEIIVAEVGPKLVKFRMTTPLAQREPAIAALRELIAAVDWARLP
jgi:hypothetical protein